MIPNFPTFKKFEVEDKVDVEKITKKFPPYSEFSLVVLLTWYNIEISILNENLVLKMQSYYDDHTPAYTLLGTTNIDASIQKLIFYSIKTGGDPELIVVPEVVIKSITSPKKFLFDEDRDSFDYILTAESLTNLKSRGKRRPLKFFLEVYADHKIEFINLQKKKTQKEIANVFHKWREHYNKPDNFLDYEYKALTKLYPYVDQIKLVAIGITYNTELIGYSIVELLHKPYAILGYQKMDRSYRGIVTMLNKVTADYLLKNEYTEINIEADLGLEGLRNAKMLLNPIKLLKKYSIRLRD